MEKEILLVNDLCGVGKVALSVMIPLLSKSGQIVHNLPTALVSNTLDYGRFDIHDTTGFMENTLKVWKELDFRFDCICTGFLVSQKQVELLHDLFRMQPQALKIVDPICGDDGHCYPGVDPDTIELRRQMIREADVIVPNLTEAALLCGKEEWANEVDPMQKQSLLKQLQQMGAKNVVITSVINRDGTHCVSGIEKDGTEFDLPYELIDVRIPGTGDVFSAVLCAALVRGVSLKESCRRAMQVVSALMEENKNNKDLFRGLKIEKALEGIGEI